MIGRRGFGWQLLFSAASGDDSVARVSVGAADSERSGENETDLEQPLPGAGESTGWRVVMVPLGDSDGPAAVRVMNS